MENIYIIGGSGFVGKNLAVYLSNFYSITVFDRYIDSDFFLNFPNIDCQQIDLIVDNIPGNFSSPDYIVNLASVVTAERDLSLFDDMVRTNIQIITKLFYRFQHCQSLKLFVQFGSSEEYGSINSPLIEYIREEPNSPYALVKQLATNLVLMLHRNDNFPATVVRPGNLFGRFQPRDKFIPYVIEKLKAGERLDVTPCEQKRDFIYIDDFSMLIREILINSSNAKGEIINVASGESISLKDIINHCKKEIGSFSVVNYGAKPYRSNEIMDLKCDITKLNEITGSFLDIDTKERLIQLINE
ncbi:nucleoside-diphosphate-sugar epimerase [Breznakibacter xylanolyticus]|uniref:Nucleoside-diphosphate-sugar epimerase n=1 Tax=Breznakibacter xylanolyticus TaxID=990 RepID=A0A2W7QBN5_9BACT|nr:NAD(P)-dependent oxidoreductase [Breznakibacter xylanolyticus]PZX19169.1 nucleoside-diphosphate-sugar epimerase [Breznakibacter xylanolyticus]